MWTISTSSTSGPRSISASTSVSGSAQPGWIYTRMPDCTERNASCGVRSFFLYSISHDIACLLLSDISALRLLVSDRCVINRPLKKLLQHLQQFQLTKNLHRAVEYRLPLQKIPQVFFCLDNRPHDLAQRDPLLGPPLADLYIPMFDIELGFTQQPVPEMAVDFVNPRFQFLARNF